MIPFREPPFANDSIRDYQLLMGYRGLCYPKSFTFWLPHPARAGRTQAGNWQLNLLLPAI